MTQPREIDRIRQRRQNQRRTWRVVLDPNLAEQVAKVQQQLANAAAANDTNPSLVTELPDLEAELERLGTSLEDATATFTFQSLGRRTFEALLDAHPAPEEGMLYDPDSFPQALIAAACVEPTLTLEDVAGYTDEETGQHVDGIWDEFPRAECDGLFATAWGLSWERPRPLSETATARTRNGGQNSPTASATASHTAGT